jgi:hypothetical protein
MDIRGRDKRTERRTERKRERDFESRGHDKITQRKREIQRETEKKIWGSGDMRRVHRERAIEKKSTEREKRQRER